MGDGGAFNIREILKQLGIKDVSELPVLKAIQPTLSVGDASAISQPFLPPTVAYGGTCTGNGTTTQSGFRITPGPAGAFVRYASLGVLQTSEGNWGVYPTPIPTTTVTALVALQMGYQPSLSSCDSFTYLSANGHQADTHPAHRIQTNMFMQLHDIIFIPPSHVFEWEVHSITIQGFGSFVVQDVIAPSLTPNG